MITDGIYDAGFIAGKADGFVTGYSEGYEAATRSERFVAEEEMNRLLNADEAIRKEYAIRVGIWKPDDSTTCWDDIIEGAIWYGKECQYRNQNNL